MTAAKTTPAGARRAGAVEDAGGLDSLLSIVQMPAGVPVATFAIGAAGATNAALCAAAILAQQAPGDRRGARMRSATRQTAGVLGNPDPRAPDAFMTVGIVGAGQLGRMLALAGYPLGLDFLFLDPAREAPGRAGRAAAARRLHRPRAARASSRSAARSLTFDWENVPVDALRRAAAAQARICPPIARARRRPGPRQREAPVRAAAAFPPRAGARSARARSSSARVRDDRPARRAQDAPPGLRRQGPGGGAQRRRGCERAWDELGRGAAALRGAGPLRLRGVDHRRAQPPAARSPSIR